MHPELLALTRASYFDTYLKYLDSADVSYWLNESRSQFIEVLKGLSEEQFEFRYRADKWSIKELVLHLIDTELIFNYRALRIGREEISQNLPGFDENAYAEQAQTSTLSKEEIIAYFHSVRETTLFLFRTFTDLQLERIGIACGHQIQVKALFLISAGHTLHHLNVIQERYLAV